MPSQFQSPTSGVSPGSPKSTVVTAASVAIACLTCQPAEPSMKPRRSQGWGPTHVGPGSYGSDSGSNAGTTSPASSRSPGQKPRSAMPDRMIGRAAATLDAGLPS